MCHKFLTCFFCSTDRPLCDVPLSSMLYCFVARINAKHHGDHMHDGSKSRNLSCHFYLHYPPTLPENNQLVFKSLQMAAGALVVSITD